MKDTGPQPPFYVAQISVHGLVRGTELELGRDADTGGQVKYVLDLSRRLATHKDVDRVDLFTRQIFDAKVGPDYAVPVEEIGPVAQIVRLPCGPKRYLRKEVLWPYLDSFVDQLVGHMRDSGTMSAEVNVEVTRSSNASKEETLSLLSEVPRSTAGKRGAQSRRGRSSLGS